MGKLMMTVFAIIGLTITTGSWVADHSGASIVHADQLGGRVQLTGAYMPAMADARALIAKHCGDRFEFVQSSETVDFRCTAPSAAQTAGATVLAMASIHNRP